MAPTRIPIDIEVNKTEYRIQTFTQRTGPIKVIGCADNEVLERLIGAIESNTQTTAGLANNKIVIKKFIVTTEDELDSFKITLWRSARAQGQLIDGDSFIGQLEGPGHKLRIGKRTYMFDSCDMYYEDLDGQYGTTFTMHTPVDVTVVVEFVYQCYEKV